MIQLSGALGRHPKLVGRVCGYALALLIAFASLLLIVNLKVQQVREGHALVLQRLLAVDDESKYVLAQLNASYPSDCTSENLTALRGLLFGLEYVRAIGMLDEQRRLYCSSGAGLLPQPVLLGGKVIEGAVVRFYMRTPVQLFNGPSSSTHLATVVERGRFQVMVDSNATRPIFNTYADSIWSGSGARRHRVFLGPHSDDVPVPPDAAPVRFDWSTGRLFITTHGLGASPGAIQSVVYPFEMGRGRQLALGAMFVMALLVGFLVGDRIARRCLHFASMDFRVRHLFGAENIVCHYQPILELTTGRVKGCEVLTRLQDQGALIYPDKFIPALTRGKLTWEFDAAASKKALQELARYLPAQRDFTVALNFFPKNLQRDILHAHLQDALRSIGRTDLKIELEVTEYEFSPEMVPELSRLKADGYFISIDDFGTGYSNLGMVKRASPDYLKIDRSFVFEMEDATVRSSLIPEIIAIARAVGSEVIAEGIETAAQARLLRELGVEYGQGYYFARPMALVDFLRYLEEHGTLAA